MIIVAGLIATLLVLSIGFTSEVRCLYVDSRFQPVQVVWPSDPFYGDDVEINWLENSNVLLEPFHLFEGGVYDRVLLRNASSSIIPWMETLDILYEDCEGKILIGILATDGVNTSFGSASHELM